ncbi:MAG: lantibiotic dehydratase family protein [Bacteroidales bacterium]
MSEQRFKYKYFEKFVVRSPLMPIQFAEKLLKDKKVSDKMLLEKLALPEVKEAIFIASPELYAELEKFLQGTTMKEKDLQRLKYSLISYLMRMSFRCTPFGMFAGFCLGEWSSDSDIYLQSFKKSKTHTRLDMDVLCSLGIDLAKDPFLRKKLLWFPNTSAYPVGEQLRYVEYTYTENRRNHHIVAVDYSSYLQRVLALCKKGAFYEDMAKCLVDDEITIDDATAFIDELIDNQVVVSEMDPAITGEEFINQLIGNLEKVPEVQEYTQLLRLTRNKLDNVDAQDLGADIKDYRAISDAFRKTGTKFEEKYFYQVDMAKIPERCRLDTSIAEDCLKAISVLNKLSPKRPETTLEKFQNKFEERYETREMPILDVLDTEMGIGYGPDSDQGDIAPLVDNIMITPKEVGFEKVMINRSLQTYLMRKFIEGITSSNNETEITDDELKDFKENWDDLPLTMSSMIRVYGKENEQYSLGISFASGSSSANLLGRFCHADPNTYKFVKEIIDVEEGLDPDRIYAEIIHLPEKRTGNILLRPILRNYEIPFLGKSAVPEEFQISLSDLYLRMIGRRLVLYSKSLAKEIVPRLSTAHNFSSNALPVYQFLCDLQTQDKRSSIGFSWGLLDNLADCYPRIKYKNIILSPAQWQLHKKEYESISKLEDEDEIYKEFTALRKKKGIPEKVYLADMDNELFLDLSNVSCIQTMFSKIKNREAFMLKEYLFDRDSAVVRSEEGCFTNEVIVSFYRQEIPEE